MNNPEAKKQEPTKQSGRSPAYPSMDLGRAIELAGKIWETQQKHEAHISATRKIIGYASDNGAAKRAIAALSHFGLTEESGKGEDRKIKLSERALDILVLNDDDPRKSRSLREAAIAPAIYQTLWEKYGVHLPDDSAIKPYLIRDKAYNPGIVDDLISDYRETFQLAKLDKNVDSASDESKKSQQGQEIAHSGGKTSMGEVLMQMTAEPTAQEMPFLVGPGKVARVPFPMAEEDFDLFLGMLNLAKKKLTTIPQPKGRPAIWKNNNTDQPVTVVGEMKAADGALYYKVEGSNAGIPASQIHFKD